MSKHRIVLVHGMGSFDKDWSKEIQELIKSNYTKVKSEYATEFDKRFKFVEVNYNSFFEERREQWKNQNEELKAALTLGGISSSLLDKITSLSDKLTSDKFYATHALDVVLYRYIKQLSEQVRTYLAEEFIKAAKFRGPWSIIAHSLGTSVTHDTLHALFTHQIKHKTLDRHFRPTNVWMLANVSRVVSDDVDVYKSVVKPTFDPSNGVVSEYFNAQHPFDPFPNVKAFHSNNGEATHWRNQVGNRYQHILLPKSDVTELNVHGFSHYLKSPLVTRALILSIGGAAAIDDEKMKIYEKNYQNKTVTATTNKVKEKFEEISLGSPSTIEAFISTTSEFRKWIIG